MIRFSKHIVIFFILCFSAASAEYNVFTDERGISIEIDSIKYKSVVNSRNEFSYRMLLPDITLQNSKVKYDIDEIRIMLAVPENTKLSYQVIKKSEQVYPQKLATLETFKNNQSDLNFSIEIIEAGFQRGIREILLRIQPYSYSESHLTLINELKLRIDFGTVINVKEKSSLSTSEADFYQHLNNQEILQYLVKSNSSIKFNGYGDNELNSDWYDPLKQYLRIATKQDGIALIHMSDVLSLFPELTSKSNSFFHLLHNGSEVPIMFLNDGNNISDLSDTAYFFGRRGYGDTTWFDDYADEAVYYLYYDESSQGKRFSSFPIVTNPQAEIKSVGIYAHIEKDKTYHRGFPQDASETNPGEGWWWSVISPSNGWDSTVTDTVMVFPANENEASLISFKFASCMWNPAYENQPSHNLSLYLNNSKVSNGTYYYGRQDSISSTVTNRNLLPGMNTVTLGTSSIFTNDNKLIEPNQTGADFYNISYNAIPFADNDESSFYVQNDNITSLLKIPSFISSNVFAIDTINNYFSPLPSVKGYFTAISTDKDNTSIVMNKSKSFYLNKRGVHVSYLDQNGNKADKYFNQPGLDVSNYLKQIPNNSLISISINSDEKADAVLVSYLQSIGCTKIINQKGKDIWVFTGIPGKVLFEDYKPSGTASIVAFIQDDNGKAYQAQLNLPENYNSNVFISDKSAIEKANVSSVNQTNLKSTENSAPVILIYNKKLRKSALDFSAYRSNADNIKIHNVDVEDIYKEFYHGRKSPHAIKDFLIYAYNNWKIPKLTHLIIWGDASWDVRKIEKGSIFEDLVPTYGWPGTDYWYTRFDDDYLPEIKVGRIPAKNDDDGYNYLNKLIVHDTIYDNPWMKKFLMISGGQSDFDIEVFYSFAKYTFSEDNIANTDLCADTMVIKKEAPSNTSESQGSVIQKEINKGVEWVYYLGHGAARVFDLDGWQVEKLNNKGKYGFMSTLACNTSAFPEPSLTSRNEDYVLTKDKGFIGTGGSSGVAFQINALNLGLLMLQALTQKNLTIETYVDALWYAKSKLIYSIEDKLTSDHYTYLGDPLVKLRIQKKPDFYLLPGEIKLTNQQNDELVTTKDSIKIAANLYNMGNRLFKNVVVRLIHDYNGVKDSSDKIIYGICYPVPFEFYVNVLDKPGLHKLKLVIDPDNQLADTKLSNNVIEFSKEVFNQGIYPLEPLANWNLNYKDPVFRVINPMEKSHDFTYRFKIFNSSDTTEVPLLKSELNGKVVNYRDFIEWLPEVQLSVNKDYWLGVSVEQNDNQASSPTLIIPFHTGDSRTDEFTDLKYSNEYTFDHFGSGSNLISEIINDTFALKLNDLKLKYKISSIYGSKKSPFRDAEITFDGMTYITVPPDILGMKLVAISGDSTKVYAVRNYQTYYETSDAVSVNRFLKDTVKENDYILIATNGESFRGFRHLKYVDPTSIGSLDSLHMILKTYYGSTLADTLDEGVGSYSLIARKNQSSFKTIESINYEGDTARIEGEIVRYLKEGNFITDAIGPAKQWSELKTSLRLADNSSTTVSILGLNKNSVNWELLQSSTIENEKQTLTLDNIDAVTYPYLKFNIGIRRAGEVTSSALTNMHIIYTPTAELTLSSDTKLLNDTLLRGEEFNILGLVKNISYRSSSTPVQLYLKSSSKSKLIDELFVDVPAINKDSAQDLSIKNITDDYDFENNIELTVNPNNQMSELYSFNNSRSLKLFVNEDNIPPTIIFKLDGKVVTDGDYVSRVPFVEVELIDNSPLPINSADQIGVGINKPFPSIHDSLFESFGRQTPLKARLSFRSDTLDFGENYYRIIAYDNAGNSDTLTIKVNVAQNGIVKNFKAYPNPFNDIVNIDFDLGMQLNDGEMTCRILNSIGQIVQELKQNTIIGNNSLQWNGFDSNGDIAPSGLYTYIIQIKSSTFFEPLKGKLIFIR